jgi:hypothetical protein
MAEGIADWELPPFVYLPIAVGISILSAIFGRKKQNGFGRIIRSIRDDFVSYQQVDDAAKSILSTIGIPEPFRTWCASAVADLLANTLTKAAPKEQVADVVASRFADLSIKESKKLLSNMPDVVARHHFARKRLAKQLIQGGKIV